MIELTHDSTTELIRDTLKEDLALEQDTEVPDNALCTALNVVIAYYSIPGTWKEGSYDG